MFPQHSDIVYELCVVTCMMHLNCLCTKAHPRALVILYGLRSGAKSTVLTTLGTHTEAASNQYTLRKGLASLYL